MKKIIERIRQETLVFPNSVHGESHWKHVAEFGQFIAKQEGLDSRLILLFAYFHDCQRHSDGTDPEHGPRAAEYVKTFELRDLGISDEDRKKLMFACRHHTYEKKTYDKDILACWDSDRLDLPRIGITVDTTRLFTKTAKEIATNGLNRGFNVRPGSER